MVFLGKLDILKEDMKIEVKEEVKIEAKKEMKEEMKKEMKKEAKKTENGRGENGERGQRCQMRKVSLSNIPLTSLKNINHALGENQIEKNTPITLAHLHDPNSSTPFVMLHAYITCFLSALLTLSSLLAISSSIS